jgi:hypothetical protein
MLHRFGRLCLALLRMASVLALDTGTHNARSERLHAVVTAWLRDTPTEVIQYGVIKLVRKLEPAETAVMSFLRPPQPPSYHPHTGCIAGQTICYPSPNLMKSFIQFNPGPLVVEYGSFMGEATQALAQAVADAQTTWGTLPTKVLAIDSFDSTTGYQGVFMNPWTWVAPPAVRVAAASAPPHPTPYYQFLVNMGVTDATKERVVPFPLLAPDALTRARLLGTANPAARPRLIYVNPVGASLKHDLPVLWRLLACGGTMAGAGYHLPDVQPEVDAFAASKAGALLEAFVVHAPGAGKYEKLEHEFSHEGLIANRKSNVSFWRFRAKPCVGETGTSAAGSSK